MEKSWQTTIMVLLLVLVSGAAARADMVITMSTTTSTENSGLLDLLLPEFTKETNIKVKVIAKGTGAAIQDGADGNVDIIFVHDRAREERFVADGYGAYWLGVMHNDFVIVGPAPDPAGVRGMKGASAALKKISESNVIFISRGDNSGTHSKEQSLWRAAGLPLKAEVISIIKKGKQTNISYEYPAGLGKRYHSIGQGMGKTLTYAEQKQAYTVADRGTYLYYKFAREQGLDLEILCQGDPELLNPYGIIPVSPKKFAHVRYEWADKLAKWLVSAKARSLIAGYRIEGQQVFYPEESGNLE